MTEFEELNTDEQSQVIQDLLELGKDDEALERFEKLLAPDTADLICTLPAEQRVRAVRLFHVEDAGNIVTYLSPEIRHDLWRKFDDFELAQLLIAMNPDDRSLLLDTLTAERVPNLLELVDPKERKETEDLLSYPEETVGRWMTPHFIRVREHWRINKTLEHIRKEGKKAESLQTLYVVDNEDHLIDDIKIREVLLADANAKIQDIMDYQFVALNVQADQEEAVRMMERYDRPVLPVINDENKLLGVVTFDDIADIAETEASEDIEKLGGMEALGERYSSLSLFRLFQKRVYWLMALFGGGIFTIIAMSSYQDKLEQQTILALFVPLVIACGGNAGTQTASLMIRALALGDVSLNDWLKVIRREFLSGILLGISLGALGFVTAFAVGSILSTGTELSPWLIGAAIGMAISSVVVCGTLVGSVLPFLFGRFGVDPATSSTPTVTIVVDVTGLFLYFFIASQVIGV